MKPFLAMAICASLLLTFPRYALAEYTTENRMGVFAGWAAACGLLQMRGNEARDAFSAYVDFAFDKKKARDLKGGFQLGYNQYFSAGGRTAICGRLDTNKNQETFGAINSWLDAGKAID